MWLSFRWWCWINSLVKCPFCEIMRQCFRSTGVSAPLIRPPTRITPSWATNRSSLYSKLVFRDALFFFWLGFCLSLHQLYKSQRSWSSSRKCSYCKHLMMVLSASWISSGIDLSTSALDLVTDRDLFGFLTSLIWSFSSKRRGMTFIAGYVLDTSSNLHIFSCSGIRATLVTSGANTDTFSNHSGSQS